tara:strand:+ start:118 stop:684 length:567 start_codon:yes stop_codon:yes gene_type:complete
MKRYLLQITRNSRIERPSEEQITLDSSAADENRWGDISQDLADDNFFILTAEQSIEITLIKLLAIDNLYSPAKILNNEGYGILEYPYSEVITFATSLRPESVAVVQYGTETSEGVNTYGTLAEAQAFIGGLNPSDGYILEDQNTPGLLPSELMASRPSLWYGTSWADVWCPPVILQQNFLGRTDPDRA